jgi:outer membrane receptor for ferric coprogen and ferric-rhodotorulic acid
LLLLAALAGVFSGGISHAQNVPSQETSSGALQPVQNSDSSPAPSKETTLPTVTVTGESLRETRTEYVGGYTPQATSLATKLPLSLRETPQSITVITRQQMDDFGLNNLDEVLQSTSSVTVVKRTMGADYRSRGFGLQVKSDGMANPLSGNLSSVSGGATDSAFLDHVEIQ